MLQISGTRPKTHAIYYTSNEQSFAVPSPSLPNAVILHMLALLVSFRKVTVDIFVDISQQPAFVIF